jgi:transcriptional regulator with XRE-family HTH domain
MDINNESIGSKIRNYREAKGLSQKELADIIGISWRHYIYIEHGERKLNIGLLVSLANALDITPDVLLADYLTGTNEPQNAEVLALFNECNPTEKAILLDMLKRMKTLLS